MNALALELMPEAEAAEVAAEVAALEKAGDAVLDRAEHFQPSESERKTMAWILAVLL